jgi:hypothetical protein
VASTPGADAQSADDGRQHPDEQRQSGAPNGDAGQTCAFCGCGAVLWVHRLSTDRVQFRKFGKGETVPSAWPLCDPCERLYQEGADDQLISLMKTAGGWIWQGTDVEDVLRKPIDIFREADLGRGPLGSA